MTSRRRIENRKYEASFYHTRLIRAKYPELSREHEKVHYSSRLDDAYFSMPDILEAFGYAKELISNPNCDVFKGVLDRYFIPYRRLQWDAIKCLDADAKEPVYQCRSVPFLNRNQDTYEIELKIWCLDGAEMQPRY